jgi:6-phosphogluconolactonase
MSTKFPSTRRNLRVKPKIVLERDAEAVAKHGAALFVETAQRCVDRLGRFVVAVSGGSTPRPMHRLLSETPYVKAIPWQGIHLFWADERLVPYESPESNFGAAKADFVDRVPLPVQQLHPMPTWCPASEGATIYQAELQGVFQRFGSDRPVFDLIVLGIGTDGHTASLFPDATGTVSNEDPDIWVTGTRGGDPQVDRLTLTYWTLNNADAIVFLVCGREKADIVKVILEDSNGPFLPAQRIHPPNGSVTWILDQGAACLLDSP